MILVTGAGGAAGIAVVQALRARGESVVAVDADPLAAGCALANERAAVTRACEPTFVHDLCETIRRFGVDVVLCTVSEEMLVLAGREDELADAGAAVWLSPRASIATCVDKWEFARALRAAAIPSPATAWGPHAQHVPGPWIVKPRFGRGSRDVYAVDDCEELQWAARRVVDPIVQTRLSGREFTVDVMIDRIGNVAGAIPRWRLETKAGISTKGRTFVEPEVSAVVTQTVLALRLQAAVNVQGFVANDGSVSIVEVNPRVSGGLPLTQAAGADVVGELVRGTRGEPVDPDRLKFQPGVNMSRHFSEVFS
jgi:carbamoyl-phosphate synthase large subunit